MIDYATVNMDSRSSMSAPQPAKRHWWLSLLAVVLLAAAAALALLFDGHPEPILYQGF